MANFLRNTGIAIIAGWLVTLLALEYMGKERFPWHQGVFSVGVVFVLVGILLRVLGTARGAVARRRCVRCGHRVLSGQVYCADHFQESIDEARDHLREK